MSETNVIPLMRVFPSIAPCEREIRLDKAGRPERCGCRGYVKLGSIAFCRRHFISASHVIEQSIKNIDPTQLYAMQVESKEDK